MDAQIAHRRRSWRWIAGVGGIIFFGLFLIGCYFHNPENRYHYPRALDQEPSSCNRNKNVTGYRLQFARFGPLLSAWPPERDYRHPHRSDGSGVWEKTGANAAELDFLGLDRFTQVLRSSNQTDEDAFIRKLRLVGGLWRSSHTIVYLDPLDPYEMDQYPFSELADGYEPERLDGSILNLSDQTDRRRILCAWPSSGGVWIYEYSMNSPDLFGVDRLVGMWKMVVTMDEAAQLLKDHGAKFYAKPAGYPLFADLFRTG
ncbi:uncharacterized protein GIQ15_03737 [Arthroderma uncinatum]|uniref:uncharacterized protein n=1 Tax=Arthroderma uncinatum TaxID=74035 RepID=UPI00144AEBC9|nr:uncharacterized protein GIQ15_03737 [Arthroderma uncinatum]KAF3484413.1 hypothetical protein GIQ15_03737 [Arthroderma uncinatum]